MSWSSRNRSPVQRDPARATPMLGIAVVLGSPVLGAPGRIAVAVLFAANAMNVAPTFAADIFVQPTATLTAENDSNLDLDPGGNPTVQGYSASLSALTGVATPNSDSLIFTRLDYRDFPKDREDDRLEGYLDFKSDYSTALSHASINGSIDRRDQFNAEFSSAFYDELNPNQPTNATTGKAVVGGSITSILLQPSYSYKFTPILGAGVSAIYQSAFYTPTVVGLDNFNYYLGKAYLDWSLSPRSELTFGAFGTKFEATRITSDANGGGVSVELDSDWTPLFSTNATVLYQHDNIEIGLPAPLNASVNTWGAILGAAYKTPVTQYRFNLGRNVTPSGGGGVYINEQAQFQYIRNFTQRLIFSGAIIGIKSSELPSNLNEDNRSYMQTAVDLKWMIRRTWFVQGGYQYSWQKYVLDSDGAANNRIYIRVGYQGLAPQR
jgi:hypothetical protein